MSQGLSTGSASLANLLTKLAVDMESIDFNDVITAIEENYRYTPTRFSNGIGGDLVINEAGSNEGSCKIFAFARLHNLGKQQTLNCFGAYYRQDVLKNPDGNDHANIRNFMKHGWQGIRFDDDALVVRQIP